MAANIDEAIADCNDAINAIHLDPVESLQAHMATWNAGAFTPIFPNPGDSPGPKRVTNWYQPSLVAYYGIEGPLATDSTIVSCSNCIDVVFRTLNAVKYATIDGAITGAQEAAIVALFNLAWT